MSKIKVLKVIGDLESFSGEGARGKYTIFTQKVKAEVDDDIVSLNIKSYKKEMVDALKEGDEFTLETKEYKGKLEAMIMAPKSGFAGKGGGFTPRPTYNQPEYDALFSHALSVVSTILATKGLKLDKDTIPLVSTYIIGATNSGVKVGDKSVSGMGTGEDEGKSSRPPASSSGVGKDTGMNKKMESTLAIRVKKLADENDIDVQSITDKELVKISNDCDGVEELILNALREMV